MFWQTDRRAAPNSLSVVSNPIVARNSAAALEALSDLVGSAGGVPTADEGALDAAF